MSDKSDNYTPFLLGLASAGAIFGLGMLAAKINPNGIGRMVQVGKANAAKLNSSITRYQDSPRSCAVLEYNGLVYISGQVANIPTLAETDITQQTEETLAKVDSLLAEAGTNKANILKAQIWVKDMKQHFEPMNKVWNAWVHPTNKGVRACVEANMAREHILVEIQVIAAMPQ